MTTPETKTQPNELTEISYDRVLTTSKQLLFIDSETCGFYGMMVLLQYAVGKDGDIVLYEVWKEPVSKTLELLEAMMKHVMVGFNLTFDHFMLVKCYTLWKLLPGDWIPEQHIEEIAALEKQARDGDCLKPYSALDLMLHSRKGPYQSLMARSDIRLKRIPLAPVAWEGRTIPMAYALANFLEHKIELDGIHFARTSDPDAPRWTVLDREKNGVVDREFADVVLKFHPDGSLKSLAEYALKVAPKYYHNEIAMEKKYYPYELGYAPYAEATSSASRNWKVWKPNSDGKQCMDHVGTTWPGVIEHHINHWGLDEAAREYAYDDIVYTRGLYYHFEEPEHGDNDSVLACMVAAVRWHGFEIDEDGMQGLRESALNVIKDSPVNPNKPHEIRSYITELCNDTEAMLIEDTTKKAKLKEMSAWLVEEDEVCDKCLGGLEPDCKRCGGGGELKQGKHPAGLRAKEVLDIKIANYDVKNFDKLLEAGRFHASFKITGTLSNRMSGSDSLNAQGIKNDPAVRRCFPLTWEGYQLCGGDFDSFEVTLADAVYNDPDLRAALCEDKKIHAMFGTCLYPEYTYEQILDSHENPNDYPFGDMYYNAKSGVFAMIYGGNASTLNRNLGISVEVAEKAFEEWGRMFPGIAEARKSIIDRFQPLLQPGGLGTQIIWNEPDDYVESFLGFRRYFTLENKIVRALFNLAQNLPKEWRAQNVGVVRSERRGVQKAWGALSSALYGAAFGVAESNVRAAANHEIQSPGADITKKVQRRIWDMQPCGYHTWRVAPMNIHDEIISVTHPDYVEKQAQIMEETVELFRDKVPLIGMSWCMEMDNWAEKKGGEEAEMVNVTFDKEAVKAELYASTNTRGDAA